MGQNELSDLISIPFKIFLMTFDKIARAIFVSTENLSFTLDKSILRIFTNLLKFLPIRPEYVLLLIIPMITSTGWEQMIFSTFFFSALVWKEHTHVSFIVNLSVSQWFCIAILSPHLVTSCTSQQINFNPPN